MHGGIGVVPPFQFAPLSRQPAIAGRDRVHALDPGLLDPQMVVCQRQSDHYDDYEKDRERCASDDDIARASDKGASRLATDGDAFLLRKRLRRLAQAGLSGRVIHRRSQSGRRWSIRLPSPATNVPFAFPPTAMLRFRASTLSTCLRRRACRLAGRALLLFSASLPLDLDLGPEALGTDTEAVLPEKENKQQDDDRHGYPEPSAHVHVHGKRPPATGALLLILRSTGSGVTKVTIEV